MPENKLGVMESRFADIVWEHQPLSSGALAKLCAEQLNWKRTTTYTVLKKLCDRGLFQNEQGTVRALLTREEFYAAQSRQFVADTFAGSLPAFVAAFSSRQKLSADEIDQLQQMIDEMRR